MPSEKLELTPLTIVGLSDYHCHCDYSIDAVGTIDEYCQAALERNLAEICFTTHYDTNPRGDSSDCFIRIKGEKKPAKADNLVPYVDDVKKAHDQFYPRGLSVKLGIEVGWWEGCAESIIKLMERFPFDYVLGGIHEIDNRSICSPKFADYFRDYSLERFMESYYRQAVIAARSGLFHALAHIGYYVRFGYAHFNQDIYEAHGPYQNELFEALKIGDTTLEINTSAIRHGFDQYYPGMQIINSARKNGLWLRYLGSDAHRPDQVGLDFEAASALVSDAVSYTHLTLPTN